MAENSYAPQEVPLGYDAINKKIMKDYYKLLGVSENATQEQIKKAYRTLALKCHPDLNQNDPKAAERFKEIAEAYGVLTDPAKHAEYNRFQSGGARKMKSGPGFDYSQEEILRDLFNNRGFQQVFQELFKEFEKSGVRFDQRFFNDVFFGGRGFVFGGFFVFGPFGSIRSGINRPRTMINKGRPKPGQIKPRSILKQIGQKITNLLDGDKKALPGGEWNKSTTCNDDINYKLTISHQAALDGTEVKIRIDQGKGAKKLLVKIPPGTRPGTRLRLKGKGRRCGNRQGNLYITVNVK